MAKSRRPENKGLPARWRHYHGAYFFQVPPGLEPKWDGKKQFRLGTTLPEAYRAWAARLEKQLEAKTIGQLLDRYSFEIIPTKAPKTQTQNRAAVTRLRAVFGSMAIDDLRPLHVYQYLDKRGQKTKTAANREMEVLSHAYTKAIEWGLTDRHPIKGQVRKLSTPPRTRYIEDAELIEALKVANPVLRVYIGLKLLTGLRRADLLALRQTDLQEDGIHVQPRKTAATTGRRLIIEWTPALRQAIDEVLAVRPKDIAPWIFCTRRGQSYLAPDGTATAWDSMWQRFMAKVLDKTEVKQRFTEHDLRAKCASDADTLEHAQRLLAHAHSTTTQRIYRRRPERVKPLR
jgi:integrase